MKLLIKILLIALIICNSCKKDEAPTNLALGMTLSADLTNQVIIVHFTNPTSMPIKIWDSTFSWGWDNLRFIIIRDDIAYSFRRDPHAAFTRNFPGYYVIDKMSGLDRKISFFDRTWVASQDAPTKLAEGDLVVCTYAVEVTPESRKEGIAMDEMCAVMKIKNSK